MEGVSTFRQKALDDTQHKISTPITGVWSPKWNSNQAINKANLENLDNNCCIKIFSFANQSDFKVPPAQHQIQIQELDTIDICPQHHIYTNDELISFSSSIQELVPKPFIYLNEKQAQILSIRSGETLTVTSNNYKFTLPFKISSTVADNVALVPFKEFIKLGPNSKISSSDNNGEYNE